MKSLAIRSVTLMSLSGGFAAVLGWSNAWVLCVIVSVIGGTARRFLAVATVLLFMLAYPPYSLPTYWICFAPMLWLWREKSLVRPLSKIVLEAMVVGFALYWLSTGFVRDALPALGWVVHFFACLLASFQIIGMAIAIRYTHRMCLVFSMAICATAAVCCEIFAAGCGVSWSVTNLALTVGATPVAQWSRWITPFGVSGILYLVNFSLLPLPCKPKARHCARWAGPALGFGIGCMAWAGGSFIAATTSFERLPFTAVLVQPHLKAAKGLAWQPWITLDQLTRRVLAHRNPIDLIIWPESSLNESWMNHDFPAQESTTQLTLMEFCQKLVPEYKTNCLAGVTIRETGTRQRYGLTVAELQRFNCGCLVSPKGEITRYEKRELVPLMERRPWFLDLPWIRDTLLPALNLHEPLTKGGEFELLSFRDQEGKRRLIAVSVCYESFFPWLPQYHSSTSADAIIHLVYDGYTAAHPGIMERHIRACQFRAIETRKWNLICSTWTGSTIIDPSGQIVSQLTATAGALSTDASHRKRD